MDGSIKNFNLLSILLFTFIVAPCIMESIYKYCLLLKLWTLTWVKSVVSDKQSN